jgi:hypothetical protein
MKGVMIEERNKGGEGIYHYLKQKKKNNQSQCVPLDPELSWCSVDVMISKAAVTSVA